MWWRASSESRPSPARTLGEGGPILDHVGVGERVQCVRRDAEMKDDPPTTSGTTW